MVLKESKYMYIGSLIDDPTDSNLRARKSF